MPGLGAAALWAAVVFAVAGIVFWVLTRRTDGPERAKYAHLTRFSAAAMAFCVFTAVLVLWSLLLGGDFHDIYVAQETSRSLPILYRFTALWSGDAGSLLFWLAVLSGYTAWAALRREKAGGENELTLNALPFLLGIAAFYLGMVTLTASPFVTTAQTLYDGEGMNALLQNGWMAIHPPMLYTGFVGMALPFALGMSSLVVGKTDGTWLRLSRQTLTFSWLALGVGILLGAHWAYIELGWGGYWAWDPVESASFLPWLAATAFLHSILVQERRGILRLWNVILVSLTFWLTMLGTFITRSGIVDSVHAFAGTGMGVYFGPFLGLGVIATGLFIYSRRASLVADAVPPLPEPSPEASLGAPMAGAGRVALGATSASGGGHRSQAVDSDGSDELLRRPKESAMLLQNLLILAAITGILIGMLFPLMTAPVIGHALAFGTQAYNRIITPFVVVGLVLLGVSVNMDWGIAGMARTLRKVMPALIAGVVVFAITLIGGSGSMTATFMYAACTFAGVATVTEAFSVVRARARNQHESLGTAFRNVVSRNRRRYGGYVAHVALAVIVLGITGSSVYGQEAVITLAPGQSAQVGTYNLHYEGMKVEFVANRQIFATQVALASGGRSVGMLAPSQVLFPTMTQPIAGVAIRSTLGGDVYTVLQAIDTHGEVATFDVFINPLVNFIWLGGILFLLGGLILFWPAKAKARAQAEARRGVAA